MTQIQKRVHKDGFIKRHNFVVMEKTLMRVAKLL